MKGFCFLFGVFLLSTVLMIPDKVLATAQLGDLLFYRGKIVSVFSNPLESYFNKKNPRPNYLFKYSCSACWRGYVATWQLEKGILHLIRLQEGTCGADAKDIPIEKVFPGRKAPVEAAWFTGVLRIPRGKRLKYVHMGYGSIYEKDLILKFEKGKLIKETIIDNTKRRALPDAGKN